MFKIRWMLLHDIEAVLEIEQQVFEYPWDGDDFARWLRMGAVALIAEFDSQVVGYLLYEALETRINLLNIGVEPSKQRCGVGTFLIDKVKDHLHPQNRFSIDTLVRERNLPAQLFLKKNGFQAVGIKSMPYRDIEEEAYEFTFTGVEPSLDVIMPELQGVK